MSNETIEDAWHLASLSPEYHTLAPQIAMTLYGTLCHLTEGVFYM